jgi:D-arabinose 1-dehydrogenase-like Zn-dependent alcohol dehydrogenase
MMLDASKMGYRVVALSNGDKKRQFALDLGAHDYIDTSKEDVNKKLQAMGGAALIVATAPNPAAIGPLTGPPDIYSFSPPSAISRSTRQT